MFVIDSFSTPQQSFCAAAQMQAASAIHNCGFNQPWLNHSIRLINCLLGRAKHNAAEKAVPSVAVRLCLADCC